MKKTIFAAGLLLASVSAIAQTNEGTVLRHKYETNTFFQNWFIGAAGGLNLYMGDYDSNIKFDKRLAPALDVSLGKWITPVSGIRLQYAGLEAKGRTENLQTNQFCNTETCSMKANKEFNFHNLHFDYMFNISNALCGYNEHRVWNLIPYAGFGWAQAYKGDVKNNEFAANFGLLNTFRLGKRVDLTLEARQLLTKDAFDGDVMGSKYDGMTSVTLGLSFKLGKTNFEKVTRIEPIDLTPYNDQINSLRAQNGRLASENKQLADELLAAKNRKVEPKTVVFASPVALFFKIGKAKLDAKGLVNLEYYANLIKSAEGKVFTIVGSADKVTGNKAYNQKLSEKRADYVYDMLINKFGVPADRLVKKAEGDTNNRFKQALLNRVVILEP